jgi:hypothetical protein
MVVLPLHKLVRKGDIAERLPRVGDPPSLIETIKRVSNIPNRTGPYGNSVKRFRSVFINGRAKVKDDIVAEVPSKMRHRLNQQLGCCSMSSKKTSHRLVVQEYVVPL